MRHGTYIIITEADRRKPPFVVVQRRWTFTDRILCAVAVAIPILVIYLVIDAWVKFRP